MNALEVSNLMHYEDSASLSAEPNAPYSNSMECELNLLRQTDPIQTMVSPL